MEWFGIRVFTDHLVDVPVPEDVEAVIAAEAEAGRRDPYRQLGRLLHVLAGDPAPVSATS